MICTVDLHALLFKIIQMAYVNFLIYFATPVFMGVQLVIIAVVPGHVQS